MIGSIKKLTAWANAKPHRGFAVAFVPGDEKSWTVTIEGDCFRFVKCGSKLVTVVSCALEIATAEESTGALVDRGSV